MINIKAQEQKEERIFFSLGSKSINDSIKGNSVALDEITNVINKFTQDSLITINKIMISSYASPEGDKALNDVLTQERSKCLIEYLNSRTSLPDSIYIINNEGVAWDMLKDMVADSEMEYRGNILDIIEDTPEETWAKVNPTDRWLTLVDSRKKHLMDLAGGIPYRNMEREFFPLLRNTTVATVYFEKNIKPSEQTKDSTQTAEYNNLTDLSYADKAGSIDTKQNSELTTTQQSKTILAFKTNLAYLAVGVTNIGVEFRLGKKLTLDLPLIYSPYTIAQKWNLRALTLQPELRYWLKNCFKGHFFGLHAQSGYYNVGVGDKYRYQDKNGNSPFYGGGLSYGYSFNLKRNWAIELTAGVGYCRFNSDVFYNVENGVEFKQTKTNYYGPTKLGVNLIYNINK